MARFEIPKGTGVLAVSLAVALSVVGLIGGAIATVVSRPVQALPAYTQQTALPCARCHTNPSGGPDLTDFGKEFQANGDKLKK